MLMMRFFWNAFVRMDTRWILMVIVLLVKTCFMDVILVILELPLALLVNTHT